VLSNRSPWTDFLLVRCDSRHDGNVVLLGNAEHTAHFSIGSGTKLAMEDAIALLAGVRPPSGRPQARAGRVRA
jgi:anthraniloyl-CoA monooxygenase